jgi:hypothetical protein
MFFPVFRRYTLCHPFLSRAEQTLRLEAWRSTSPYTHSQRVASSLSSTYTQPCVSFFLPYVSSFSPISRSLTRNLQRFCIKLILFSCSLRLYFYEPRKLRNRFKIYLTCRWLTGTLIGPRVAHICLSWSFEPFRCCVIPFLTSCRYPPRRS